MRHQDIKFAYNFDTTDILFAKQAFPPFLHDDMGHKVYKK